MLSLIRAGKIRSAHDLSDGGLALGLAEAAIKSGIGAEIAAPEHETPATWFGEDQGRYIVTASADLAGEIVAGSPVSATIIGATGGDTLKLGAARSISVTDLNAAYEGWFPTFMGATIN